MGLEAYSISDPFNIGGIGWQIKRLSADGSYLEIERVEEEVLPRTALREGEAAPVFTARTLRGETLSLSNLRGKYVLLNFAATWCPYSQAELPNLKTVNTSFDKEKLMIVTIIEDESPSNLSRYIGEKQLPWTHIHQNRNHEVPSLYRVLGFPTNYLINPEGKIIAKGDALRGTALVETLKRYVAER